MLEFSNGLNVITGNSDSGKTAIIRAIKWALFNEPRGDFFIREGSSDVSVTVFFNNGLIIKRLRGKSKNKYIMTTPSNEEYQFDGFGSSVPAEIVEAISMTTIPLGQNSKVILNIQDQLDGPFLLQESPSIKASAIGRLNEVNYIDDALRDVIKDNKGNAQIERKLMGEKEKLESEIDEYKYLNDYIERSKRLNEIISQIESTENTILNLQALENEFREITKDIAKIKMTLNALGSVDKLREYILLIENKNLKFKDYSTTLEKFNSNLIAIKEIESSLKKLSNLENLEEDIKNLDRKLLEYNNLLTISENLNGIQNELGSLQKKLLNFKKIDGLDLTTISRKIDFLTNLNIVYEEYTDVTKRIGIGNGYLELFSNLDSCASTVESIETVLERASTVISIKDKLSTISSEIVTTNGEVEDITNKIDGIIKNYNLEISKSGLCPYCFNKVDQGTLSHIEEHLRGEL